MIDTQNILAAAIQYTPMTDLPFLTNWGPGKTYSGSTTEVFNSLFSLSMQIGAMLAVFMFIWGGLQMITARDNAGTVGDGKKKMTNAVMGLIMLISTYVVLDTINPQLTSLTLLEDVSPLGVRQDGYFRNKNNQEVLADRNTGDYCYSDTLISTSLGYGRTCYPTPELCKKYSKGKDCFDQNKDIKTPLDPTKNPLDIVAKYSSKSLQGSLYCDKETSSICFRSIQNCSKYWKAGGKRGSFLGTFCKNNKQTKPGDTSVLDEKFSMTGGPLGKVVAGYTTRELCEAKAKLRSNTGAGSYTCSRR